MFLLHFSIAQIFNIISKLNIWPRSFSSELGFVVGEKNSKIFHRTNRTICILRCRKNVNKPRYYSNYPIRKFQNPAVFSKFLKKQTLHVKGKLIRDQSDHGINTRKNLTGAIAGKLMQCPNAYVTSQYLICIARTRLPRNRTHTIESEYQRDALAENKTFSEYGLRLNVPRQRNVLESSVTRLNNNSNKTCSRRQTKNK